MSYDPSGKVKPFVDAVRVQPSRIWTPEEIAKLMDVEQGRVGAWLSYPMQAGVVFRGKQRGQVVYSGQPFPPEAAYPTPAERNKVSAQLGDIRVPKFGEAWTPKPMVAPRPGSETPRVASTPKPAPLAAAPAPLPHDAQMVGREEDAVADAAAVASPAPTPEPTRAPTPAPTQEPAAQEREDEDDLAESDALAEEFTPEEDVEPDAYISCRTGEIVLVGIEPDEEGRITIPPDLVQAIKRQIAWSPAR